MKTARFTCGVPNATLTVSLRKGKKDLIVSVRQRTPDGDEVNAATGCESYHDATADGEGQAHIEFNRLASCGLFGGGLVVETGGKKRGRIPEYIGHRHRANSACPNTLRVSVAEMNEAVLQAIEAHALTPDAIEQVIQLTERDDVRDQQAALARERKDVERRIANITAAIEADGLGSLLKRLRELEDRLSEIDAAIASLRPIPRLALAVIENRLAEWRRLLRQSTTQGRAALQRIIRGRLTFTPRADGGYDFSGPTRFDKLFTGIVVERPKWIPESRVGTEHIGPSDTFDGDYGRLLQPR